jgi:phenylacetate-CoA ligase
MVVRAPLPSELEPIERASRDEIESLQLERLQATLRRCYENVPHYRAAFESVGVHPDDARSLGDLAMFPLTNKADLRNNYPFGMFAVDRKEVVRIHASSGTTGKPTVVGYTANDISTWADLMARSIRASGGRPGDMVHISYGYGLFTGGLGAHYGAERLGCTVVPMSGGQTEKQVQLIEDFKPDIIMVTPSYAVALAEEMHRQGINPKTTSLQVGIFGAEPWSDGLRLNIEATLGLDAVDIYGLSEVMGPGVANECIESKDGLTLWEDHFLPEIIDPETGQVLPDGSFGELVLTSLTKEAFPVVRYRTRDLTKLLPPTARSMRRLARIGARSDDMMIIRGVNVFPSQVEELLLRQPEFSPHYQLVIGRSGALDELSVMVESLGSLTTEECEQSKRTLAGRMKDLIGVTAFVKVVPPGSVERSIGKAKRVVDERPKNS